MPEKIEKRKRTYFAETFDVEQWSEVEQALQKMLGAPIASPSELMVFIEKYGELSDILDESGAWKMIRMNQRADDPELARIQADFFEQVLSPAAPYFFQLDKKIFESIFFGELPEERYRHLGKILQSEIELFREKNLPLFVAENELVNRYGEIYSQLTVSFEGEEKTLSAMDLVFKDPDRARREKAWRLVAGELLAHREEFENLFDQLKKLRIEIAYNAGCENYRDYMHKEKGRFDYTPEDLYTFHAAIKSVAVPALKKVNARRARQLGVESLRPWDMAVDPEGGELRPFSTKEELLTGALRILDKIEPEFADQIAALSVSGLLDLDNRKGKAPGGYNCNLDEMRASFIFMNAVGIHTDVQAFLHESGHALHAFALRDEKIVQYRNPPHEINEVASTAMELFLLDHLGEFYADPADVKRAKREHLEDVLAVFPAVAAVDAFQHWIYLHPQHTSAERDAEFSRLKQEFSAGVDWSGLEKEREVGWLQILHIFEVPFYYIEYAFAQLGAIALYKQFKENPQSAIGNYRRFLAAGYAKSVPEVYAAAGIKFDFSPAYLEEMIGFVLAELAGLEGEGVPGVGA